MSLRTASALIMIVTCWSLAVAAEPSASRPASRPTDTLVPVPEAMTKDIPPLRSPADLRRLLGESKSSEGRPIHVVLVAGPKDHGPGEHDYPAWQKAWELLLGRSKGIRVSTAWEKPSDEDLKAADVLVLFKHCAWPAELNEKVDAFMARGGGMVLLHFAVDCCGNGKSVGEHIGPYWGPGAAFRHGWVELEFADKPEVDFLRGLAGKKLRFHDESYWKLTGDPGRVEVLATGLEEDGKVRIPLIWNKQSGKGRVHVNILGHYNWTFNDPLFRLLVLRGIAWSAGQPVDRFSDLAATDVTFIKEAR